MNLLRNFTSNFCWYVLRLANGLRGGTTWQVTIIVYKNCGGVTPQTLCL
jgi:hypothetical protein